ncbi:hypothetical protein DFH09DRAFT_1501533 [Mycena vulgaris]|nr:hypothetical protein DFH09DRAFT_1501533 [Mycena vulgaris]
MPNWDQIDHREKAQHAVARSTVYASGDENAGTSDRNAESPATRREGMARWRQQNEGGDGSATKPLEGHSPYSSGFRRRKGLSALRGRTPACRCVRILGVEAFRDGIRRGRPRIAAPKRSVATRMTLRLHRRLESRRRLVPAHEKLLVSQSNEATHNYLSVRRDVRRAYSTSRLHAVYMPYANLPLPASTPSTHVDTPPSRLGAISDALWQRPCITLPNYSAGMPTQVEKGMNPLSTGGRNAVYILQELGVGKENMHEIHE